MKWIIPIMGFRETSAQQTGIERAWKTLRPLIDASVCMVTPYEWDEDMRGLVSFILRNSDESPEAMVIAYSWGCGVGFTTFAREALAAKLPIRLAVLCDPVYRSRALPTWLPFNPFSVSPILRPSIRIPASVERVEWVRQHVDIPAGHDLIAEDPALTLIGRGRHLNAGHTSIDDSPEFQSLVEELATEFVHGLLPKL